MRWLRLLFLPVSLAILVTATFTVPLPVFTERPGQLRSLTDFVVVEADGAGPVDGDFLLTAVTLRRATPAGFVRGLVDDEVSLLRDSRFIPPGIDDDTYFDNQRAVFAATADVAAALGLQAAGYPADPRNLTGDGVLVVQTLPGSPAEGVLESGDVIVGVGGDEVRTADDLVGAVSAEEVLSLRFTRDGQERSVELVPEVRDVAGEPRPVIGVTVETLHPRIDLPISVEVDSGRIGGPSAGLMIALTVHDMASPTVDLAAGRLIAGTGAIDAEGNVRPIGGVRQKVVAASQRGADVFLLPAEQAPVAEELVPDGGMEIVGVGSYDDAVRALTESGGQSAEAAEAGDRAGGRVERPLAARGSLVD